MGAATVVLGAGVSVLGPACLPWQENPYRLVSLWDIMNRIAAHNLVHTGRVLQALAMNITADITPELQLNQEATDEVLKHLGQLRKDCGSLALSCTGDLLAWIIEDYANKAHTWGQVRSTVELVTTAYQQELGREFFAHINHEKAKYMRSFDDSITNPAYGLKAFGAFPGSARDMALAGNCLACGFNDACVIHLMRVLELGLGALARVFSVPFKHENWHNIIEQLESKIRKIDSAFGPDWKDKQKFYAEAACEFMFLKDAWRNHAVHGHEDYDDDRGKNIFDHVCVFMKHLAEGGLTE